MQVFLNYLEKHPLLSSQTKDVLAQSVKVQFHRRGDLLRQEGEICDKIYFIRKGLVHIYKQRGGKKKTEWLAAENQMICPYNRFVNQESSTVIYEALEPTEVHIVDYSSYNSLCQFSDFRNMITSMVIEKIYTINGFLIGNTGDAGDRYVKFVNHFPNIVNRVPVNIIASFLDVCPKTISRIRASKNNTSNNPHSFVQYSDRNFSAIKR